MRHCVVMDLSSTIQFKLKMTLGKKAFENMGKEENAGNQHFLLFPQYFLANQDKNSPFEPALVSRLHVLSI